MSLAVKVSVALALAALCAARPAFAQARITEETKFYQISGKTGMELLRDMNRRGPRHGFLTKAIAQTQFKTGYSGDFVYENGVCHAKGASYNLHITYVYPQPKVRFDSAMARRWKVFQATNIQHEREHGRIAKKMANTIGKKLRAFKVKDSRGCDRPVARLSREIDAIVTAQNKEQMAYDKREHRDGGPVEKSIFSLIGKKK
ncbi:MAG: DUF922 domain-containing protein [Mesorhizobium sp.]